MDRPTSTAIAPRNRAPPHRPNDKRSPESTTLHQAASNDSPHPKPSLRREATRGRIVPATLRDQADSSREMLLVNRLLLLHCFQQPGQQALLHMHAIGGFFNHGA